MLDYIDSALAHALEEYPRESCGVVIVLRGRRRYIPCRNIAENPAQQFTIHPEDFADAEDVGEIVEIVHSHVDTPPTPSQADLLGCEATQLPWIIVNGKTGASFRFEPSGYTAPLIGREFSHGILDCYTLIKDYYAKELGIILKDYDRSWEWWNNGGNLYLDNFTNEGFVTIPEQDIEKHDVVLLQVRSHVPNHGGVYLGDNVILHHPMGRLSGRDVYGGYWKKHTTHVIRHKDFL